MLKDLIQSCQKVLIGPHKNVLQKNQNGYEKTQNFVLSTKLLYYRKKITKKKVHTKNYIYVWIKAKKVHF